MMMASEFRWGVQVYGIGFEVEVEAHHTSHIREREIDDACQPANFGRWTNFINHAQLVLANFVDNY